MKINQSLTIATDTETSAVTIAFVDENGKNQTIHVPPQAADLLLLGLLSSPSARRPDGKASPQRPPLMILGADSVQYENGYVGLSLRLAETVFLHIAFPPAAIPLLHDHLDRLLNDNPPAVH